jgi:dynein intermediate chain
MLSQPQETLELQHKQSKPIAVTCLAFPQADVNNFIVGSEDGSVYTGETTLHVSGKESLPLIERVA